MITGASNVSNAMGYGKKAARSIDERLMSDRRWEDLFPDFEYEQATPAQASESRRHHVKELPAEQRVKGFDEAVVGFSDEDAQDEANRCLRCDIRKT